MRHLFFCLLLLAGPAVAQTPAQQANELIQAGTELHDAGKYDEALARYQQALQADPNNPLARSEMALTLNAAGRYAEAVQLCRQLLKEDPRVGPTVYVSLGNSLDSQQKPKEALVAYQQGIKEFPTAYMLHFNAGVTQLGAHDLPGAQASFEQALLLNPRHASSHMLLGSVQLEQGHRVPGLLALARFLVLEPASRRSSQRREWLDEAMTLGVSQQSSNHVTVSIPAASLGKKSGTKGDDFGPEEMLLSLAAATNLTVAGTLDSLGVPNTPVNRFIKQFSSLCSILGERQEAAGRGFTRTYYAPYFAALGKKGFVPALAYLVHSSQADSPEVQQWLAAHPTQVQVFQEWSKNYEWPKP